MVITLRKIFGNIALFSLVVIFLIWTLFPIFWILSIALKSGSQLFTWPPTYIPYPPVLTNFKNAIVDRHVLTYMNNTIVVVLFTTPLSVLISALAAFSLSRFRFRGRDFIMNTILSIRMLPALVIAIPVFFLFQKLALIDNLISLIIVYTAFNLPFNIWLLIGFFEEISVEIEDAALVDGCSSWQLFTKILLPLTAPGLAASAIFCALFAWNEFSFALILTYTLKSQTLPIAIGGLVYDLGIFFGQLGAIGTIGIIPIIIFGIYVQKYLVQGMTAGAVKE